MIQKEKRGFGTRLVVTVVIALAAAAAAAAAAAVIIVFVAATIIYICRKQYLQALLLACVSDLDFPTENTNHSHLNRPW